MLPSDQHRLGLTSSQPGPAPRSGSWDTPHPTLRAGGKGTLLQPLSSTLGDGLAYPGVPCLRLVSGTMCWGAHRSVGPGAGFGQTLCWAPAFPVNWVTTRPPDLSVLTVDLFPGCNKYSRSPKPVGGRS